MNVDMRKRTYPEQLVPLTNKRLELRLRVPAEISLRSGTVRNVVEKFGNANWYEANVRMQFRAAVRDEVRKYGVLEVKSKLPAIEKIHIDSGIFIKGADCVQASDPSVASPTAG